jgi:hypothetical protein
MPPPTKLSDRQDAIAAIVRHLQKPEAFARVLCAGLTDLEAEQAAHQLDQPNGAVALAGLIYRALNRQGLHELAESVAYEDFDVICRHVPIDSPAERPPTKRSTPGIRVIDSSDLPNVPP